MELLTTIPKLEPVVWNYKEVKDWVQEGTSQYLGLVITKEQVPEAKNDRAKLNKLKEAIESKRKEVKKELAQPYNVFEGQVKEITALIEAAINGIDTQIKDFENKEKESKKDDIERLFTECEMPSWLKLTQIWSEKWLNKTVNLTAIGNEFVSLKDKIATDIQAIHGQPDFVNEAELKYRETLNLGEALSYAFRLRQIASEKAKEDTEYVDGSRIGEPTTAQNAEELSFGVEDEERTWITFSAYLSTTQALKLRDFFKANHIEFKKG